MSEKFEREAIKKFAVLETVTGRVDSNVNKLFDLLATCVTKEDCAQNMRSYTKELSNGTGNGKGLGGRALFWSMGILVSSLKKSRSS